MATYYCNQSVWPIDLDLNVASYVFWSLIWFWEAPWQGLVCFVLEITTTGKGPVCYVLTFYSQYLYSESSILFFILNDHKIHLLRLILCYCTLIYDKSVIIIMFYFKSSHNFVLFTNYEYFPLWYFEHNILMQTNKSTTFQFPIIHKIAIPMRHGELLGVGWLWWVISLIIYKLPIFS